MVAWRIIFGRAGLAFASSAAIAAIASSGGGVAAQSSPVAAAAPAGAPVWLDQNWSAADRAWYHHAGQGTSTLPIP